MKNLAENFGYFPQRESKGEEVADLTESPAAHSMISCGMGSVSWWGMSSSWRADMNMVSSALAASISPHTLRSSLACCSLYSDEASWASRGTSRLQIVNQRTNLLTS